MVVQANQFSGWAQKSNPCEIILSTEDEYRSNGRSLGDMQWNGESSNIACFECVLGVDWPGSVQSFVSQCKAVNWGRVWGNGGYMSFGKKCRR